MLHFYNILYINKCFISISKHIYVEEEHKCLCWSYEHKIVLFSHIFVFADLTQTWVE